MRHHAAILAMLMLVAMLLGCTRPNSASDAPERQSTSASFLDAWQFPAEIARFRRVTFEPTPGRQMIAGYNLEDRNLPIAMTVYVYRVGGVTSIASPPEVVEKANQLHTEAQFEREKAAIVAAHGESLAPVTSAPTTVNPGGPRRAGLSAGFHFRERYAGQIQDIRSEIYYFREGDWAVKYRVTYPLALRNDAEPAVRAFMEQLAWP